MQRLSVYTLLLLGTSALHASDAPTAGTDPSTQGVVAGVITFEGDVPKLQTPDNAGIQHPLLRVNAKDAGVQFVVVYIAGLRGDATPAPESAAKEGEPAPKPPTIDQRDYQFEPRVIAIRDGQSVAFANSDSGNHNVRAASLESRNQFNVFTGAGASYSHRFYADRKGRPVRIGCDLHHWMAAWVYVFDHPYFSVTDREGEFQINGVPPGEHAVWIVQPDVGARISRRVTVVAGKTETLSLKLTNADFSANVTEKSGAAQAP